MDMPSRIQIRQWLRTKTRVQIMGFLAEIKSEHGDEAEQDVRHFLNVERKESAEDKSTGESPAEASLLSEHEQQKQEVKNNIESLKRLHKFENTAS